MTIQTVIVGMLVMTTLACRKQATPAGPPDEPRLIHHQLTATLDPANHAIAIDGVVSGFPIRSNTSVRFHIHDGLAVESADPAFAVERVSGDRIDAPVPVATYLIRPASGEWRDKPAVRLRIAGAIHHPLVSEEENYARSFSRTAGTISDAGAMLNGASYWLPSFGDHMVTLRMTIEVPDSWDAVSQGTRQLHSSSNGKRRVTWASAQPMEEVYLIAGGFTVYQSAAAAPVATYAYLRTPDEAQAEQGQIDRAAILAEIRALRVEIAELAGTSDRRPEHG